MTTQFDQTVDWAKAAKEAFVVGPDGSLQAPADEPLYANTREYFDSVQESEVRTPTFHAPIERIKEKIGAPTIYRSSVNISSLEARELEAERVRAEAQVAKEQRIAEEFMLTPQGRRIVALEEKVAGISDKLDQILAAVETNKSKTTRASAKKEATDG